jgi:nuclear pore complex protein Nup155
MFYKFRYLGDNAAVDAISLRLREVCPSLFKSEDAIGSKVAEILAKVKNSNDAHERELLLKESLVLSEKICGHGRVNIRNLCKQYSDLGFPVGAVRLCLSAAKAADPEQFAISTTKTSSASNDPVGMQAYQTRADIYRIVFDLLDNYVHLASFSQSPLGRKTDNERCSPQTAQLCAEETIHAILTSDDEMFHVNLYNWLLEKKQFDRLLEIKHPYLDSFLQRAADAVVSGKWPGGGINSNDTRVLDLLWRHHEMNQNHGAAAQILSKLAESTT